MQRSKVKKREDQSIAERQLAQLQRLCDLPEMNERKPSLLQLADFATGNIGTRASRLYSSVDANLQSQRSLDTIHSKDESPVRRYEKEHYLKGLLKSNNKKNFASSVTKPSQGIFKPNQIVKNSSKRYDNAQTIVDPSQTNLSPENSAELYQKAMAAKYDGDKFATFGRNANQAQMLKQISKTIAQDSHENSMKGTELSDGLTRQIGIKDSLSISQPASQKERQRKVNDRSSPINVLNAAMAAGSQTNEAVQRQQRASRVGSLDSSNPLRQSGGQQGQFNLSSVSRGIENRVTGPGVTRGDVEDTSSALNTRTHHMREVDIDIDVGGFVSNLSASLNSASFMLPLIKKRAALAKDSSGSEALDASLTQPLSLMIAGSKTIESNQNTIKPNEATALKQLSKQFEIRGPRKSSLKAETRTTLSSQAGAFPDLKGEINKRLKFELDPPRRRRKRGLDLAQSLDFATSDIGRKMRALEAKEDKQRPLPTFSGLGKDASVQHFGNNNLTVSHADLDDVRQKNSTVAYLDRNRRLNEESDEQIGRRKTVRLVEPQPKGARSKDTNRFWCKQSNQIEGYVRGKRYAPGLQQEGQSSTTRMLSSSVALPNIPSRSSPLSASLQTQSFVGVLSPRERRALLMMGKNDGSKRSEQSQSALSGVGLDFPSGAFDKLLRQSTLSAQHSGEPSLDPNSGMVLSVQVHKTLSTVEHEKSHAALDGLYRDLAQKMANKPPNNAFAELANIVRRCKERRPGPSPRQPTSQSSSGEESAGKNLEPEAIVDKRLGKQRTVDDYLKDIAAIKAATKEKVYQREVAEINAMASASAEADVESSRSDFGIFQVKKPQVSRKPSRATQGQMTHKSTSVKLNVQKGIRLRKNDSVYVLREARPQERRNVAPKSSKTYIFADGKQRTSSKKVNPSAGRRVEVEEIREDDDSQQSVDWFIKAGEMLKSSPSVSDSGSVDETPQQNNEVNQKVQVRSSKTQSDSLNVTGFKMKPMKTIREKGEHSNREEGISQSSDLITDSSNNDMVMPLATSKPTSGLRKKNSMSHSDEIKRPMMRMRTQAARHHSGIQVVLKQASFGQAAVRKRFGTQIFDPELLARVQQAEVALEVQGRDRMQDFTHGVLQPSKHDMLQRALMRQRRRQADAERLQERRERFERNEQYVKRLANFTVDQSPPAVRERMMRQVTSEALIDSPYSSPDGSPLPARIASPDKRSPSPLKKRQGEADTLEVLQEDQELEDYVKRTLIKRYLTELEEELEADEQREREEIGASPRKAQKPPDIADLTDEQVRELIINVAALELSEEDMFNLQKDHASTKVELMMADFKRQTEGAYINYLTQGRVDSRIIYEFSRSFRKRIRGYTDVITRFNVRAMETVDHLINDILQALRFKDLRTSQGPRYPENQTTFKAKPRPVEDYEDDDQVVKQIDPNESSRNFIFEAINSKSIALPILQKIHQKTLILQNYNMSEGVCRAVREGLLSDRRLLDVIFIDNCGLSDFELSLILDGACGLESLQRLTLKNTDLSTYSLSAAQKILNKTFPHSLMELSIVRSRLSLAFQFELFDQLCSGYSTLARLALVKVGLTRESLQRMAAFLSRYNTHLRHLDVSFNDVASPLHFSSLLAVLGDSSDYLDNKEVHEGGTSQLYLETISLAGNCLYDPRHNKKGNKKEKGVTDVSHEGQVAQQLRAIVQRNDKLMHLNLSNTGLSTQIMKFILPNIKMSPSLIAVHLSGNPGVNEKLLKFVTKDLNIAKSKPRVHPPAFEVIRTETDQRLALSTKNRETLMTRRIQKDKSIIMSTDLNFEPNTLETHVGAASLSTSWLTMQRFLGHDKEFPGRRLSDWQLNTEPGEHQGCWVCDRQIYSLMFWNEKIGTLQNQRLKNEEQIVDMLEKRNWELIEELEDRQEKLWEMKNKRDQKMSLRSRSSRMLFKVEPEKPSTNDVEEIVRCKHQRPILFSEFYNFVGVELLTLAEYCFLIDKYKEHEHFDKLRFEDIRDIELTTSSMRRSAAKKDHTGRFAQSDVYEQLLFYRDAYREVIDSCLDYRDPHFINVAPLCIHAIQNGASGKDAKREEDDSDDYEQEEEDLFAPEDPDAPYLNYVVPQFLRAGRQQYVIYHKGRWYFHKALVQFRQESIPYKTFTGGAAGGLRLDPQAAMFTDYRVDTAPRIKRCCEHDLRHIHFEPLLPIKVGAGSNQKILHTMEEAKGAFEKLSAFITNKFKQLKWQFTSLLSDSSSAEGIDLDTASIFFAKHCCMTKVSHQDVLKLGKEVLTRHLDASRESGLGQYSTSSAKPQRDPQKSSTLLCRKEYIELLLHLAAIEYPQFDFVQGVEFIFSTVNRHAGSFEDWKRFRERQLWGPPVQHLLYANREVLRQIFEKYVTEDTHRVVAPYHISYAMMQRIFMADSVPPLCASATAIRKACALSKQTVEKDFENANGTCLMYARYDFREFLEVIGRMADIKSAGTPLEGQFLHNKIEAFLGQLLRITNRDNKIQRYVPQHEDLYSSYDNREMNVAENVALNDDWQEESDADDKESVPLEEGQEETPPEQPQLTLPCEVLWRHDLDELPDDIVINPEVKNLMRKNQR